LLEVNRRHHKRQANTKLRLRLGPLHGAVTGESGVQLKIADAEQFEERRGVAPGGVGGGTVAGGSAGCEQLHAS
jgi:hypothetical protein